MSLWQNRHTLAKIENFEAYVFTVARNRALYYIKKKKADLLDFDHTAIEIVPENSPESLVINSELKTPLKMPLMIFPNVAG
ncbi:MAG: hypothetical protein HC905_28200 [Bacteroidales bacterium]|nr:hypothetical protein [Bacteroidales bacterium]